MNGTGREVSDASGPISADSASPKSPVEIPRRYRVGNTASSDFVRRANRGTSAEVNLIGFPSVAPRSRAFGRGIFTGPIPVRIYRSGPCP